MNRNILAIGLVALMLVVGTNALRAKGGEKFAISAE